MTTPHPTAEQLAEAAEALNTAIDAYWNSPERILADDHLVKAVCAAQAVLQTSLTSYRASPAELVGGTEVQSYWFLENAHGEWLTRFSDQDGDYETQLPYLTRDHTKAWRFESLLAANECRARVLGYKWKDKFSPTEHANEPVASPPPVSGDEGLLKALEECRDQFLFYKAQHQAKRTYDGDAKAKVNQQFAAKCTHALAAYRASHRPAPTPVEGERRERPSEKEREAFIRLATAAQDGKMRGEDVQTLVNAAWARTAWTARDRDAISRIVLFESGMFNSDAEIVANADHSLVRQANRIAERILSLPPAQGVEQAGWREPGFVKPDTDKQVFFYEQDFYVLSNFSAFSLRWANRRFDTSEAAYHSEKFPCDSRLRAEIQAAPSAHEAFKIAEAHKAERRPDWDNVKVNIMRDILRAKVGQHEYVRRKLLATGDRELIEDSWRDDFWGWGPNRDGQNMLGKLWMEIRAELQADAVLAEIGKGGAT